MSKRYQSDLTEKQGAIIHAMMHEVGYDGGKKIKGRKRHIMLDVLGLLLTVMVH